MRRFYMKWALVLSGGGARGIAYIGLLEALENLGYPKPSLITGCSIGAIMGGMYASGMTAQEMKDFMLHEFELKHYLTVASMSLPVGKVSKVIQIGEGLTNFIRKSGMESGVKVLEFFRNMTNNIAIEDSPISFMCNATNLLTGKEKLFKTGNMAQAMRASMSIPGIFEPAEVADELYLDGYLTHNAPTWAAYEAGFSNILTVYIDKFKVKPPEEVDNGVAIVMRAIEIAALGTEVRPADIPTTSLLLPDAYSSYDFGHIAERIQTGYDITMKHKPLLDAFFEKRPLIGFLKRKKLHRLEKNSEENT